MSRRIAGALNAKGAVSCRCGTSMCIERCGVVRLSWEKYGPGGDPPTLMEDGTYWFVIPRPMRDRWRPGLAAKARQPKWARARQRRVSRRLLRRIGPWPIAALLGGMGLCVAFAAYAKAG